MLVCVRPQFGVDKKMPIRMHSTLYLLLEPDQNLKNAIFQSVANGLMKRAIFFISISPPWRVHPLVTAEAFVVVLVLCTSISFCCCRRRSTPTGKVPDQL